ncbi:MAG: zinc-finger domain-containing protein [Alphaproteobacteria bacterium]
MPDYKTPETIKINPHADGVSCDGGNGSLGHPKVWYTFDGANQVECGYCDRLFVKSA